MGLNFDNYPSFQLKITHEHHCKIKSPSSRIEVFQKKGSKPLANLFEYADLWLKIILTPQRIHYKGSCYQSSVVAEQRCC